MTDQSNRELVQKAVDGDEASLTSLLKKESSRLRGALHSRISKTYQAHLSVDDVVQITYLEAFLRIKTFVPRDDDSFFGWLRRIAENNLRDAIRAIDAAKRPSPHQRVDMTAQDSSSAFLVELLSASSASPSRQVAEREARSILEKALDRLPPDYARVLRLYELEGKSVREVAESVGKSQGAVFMIRARAIERIRDVLPTESKFFSKKG